MSQGTAGVHVLLGRGSAGHLRIARGGRAHLLETQVAKGKYCDRLNVTRNETDAPDATRCDPDGAPDRHGPARNHRLDRGAVVSHLSAARAAHRREDCAAAAAV